MAQGSLVHAVLEKLVLLALEQSPAERTLDHVLARPATLVPRPSREEVERTLLACAEKTARDEGLAGEGRARLLAEQVRPLVEKALELEWSDENPLRVAGVEVLGEVALQTQEGPRTLSFKADRVDRDETRALLIDYKTGRVPGTREREPATIGQGNWLQGAAYALAAGSGATGRYLYLSTRKEMPPEERRLDIRLDDAAREAFGAAVGSALGVWERGILFPRLLDPDDLGIQGKSCKFCEVKTACLQGDSGARRRLKIWLEAQRESGDARAEPQATLVGLYDLPRTREAPPPEQAGATSDGETP
jgi:hypothetical protein